MLGLVRKKYTLLKRLFFIETDLGRMEVKSSPFRLTRPDPRVWKVMFLFWADSRIRSPFSTRIFALKRSYILLEADFCKQSGKNYIQYVQYKQEVRSSSRNVNNSEFLHWLKLIKVNGWTWKKCILFLIPQYSIRCIGESYTRTHYFPKTSEKVLLSSLR